MNEPENRVFLEISEDSTNNKIVIRELIHAFKMAPRSREISLVITKLEEAEMWLIKAQSVE